MRADLLEKWNMICEKCDFEEMKNRIQQLMGNDILKIDPTTNEYIEICKEYNELAKILNRREDILKEFQDIEFYEELAQEEEYIDERLNYNILDTENHIEKILNDWELELMFNGKYDDKDIYLTIHAGSGGTEAQDWAQMLSRMYMRWADKNGATTEIIDSLNGDTAGIKSITLNIRGENIYGKLKGEHGVHRLVRVSPFDAKNRRHTSFSAVEVLPQLELDKEIEINPADIEIQTFRSGGPGGQYQNTTDSGCRLIHKPTGIVVESRQERSQMQNRRICGELLAGKLLRQREEEHRAEINKLNEKTENGWGHAIRSYVFMPYQLVKDNRTGFETGKVEAVLDGDLNNFIREYLIKC